MSRNTNDTKEQPTKPTSGKPEELNETELEDVSGGINPQPLPPLRHIAS